MNRNRQLMTYGALSAAVIFWGLSFVATKIALEQIPPFPLIALRFALAAAMFLLLMLRRGLPSFTKRDHLKVLFIAAFEPGLYFVFETLGLQLTSAAKTALIIATIPIAVLILAALLLGERTSPKRFIGIGLSLVGITVLMAGDRQLSFQMEGALLGDLFVFGAVLSAAFYIVLTRRMVKHHSAVDITSMQVIYGALFFLPAGLFQLPDVQWAAIGYRALAALLYLTLFATVAAFLCYNYALKNVPASRAAVFINGIPVVTALGAWMLLGEMLSGLQVLGGVLVLAGVYLANRPSRKSDDPSDPEVFQG